MAIVIDAQGTTFTFDSTLVGNIISWTGFDGSATEIDITNLDSTAKEFRQGLQDNGNISFELQRNTNDPGQAAMTTAQTAQETKTCVLTIPDQDVLNVFTFSAFVVTLSMDGGVDGVVTGTANLRITGPVVETDETP